MSPVTSIESVSVVGPMVGPDLVVDTASRGVGVDVEATIRLDGAVCAGTTHLLASASHRLLDEGVRRMHYDLRELRFCTSDGVELWLRVLDRLRLVDGELVLSHANRTVRRVLAAAGTPELEATVAP
jgi:anti-anti-sigma regulatory factor